MNNNNTLHVCYPSDSKHNLPRDIVDFLKKQTSVSFNQINSSLIDFASGEIKPELEDSVRRKEVIFISAIEDDINKQLIQTFLYLDAIRRAGAARINVWMPFYMYARQDKKSGKREPISSAFVARTLELLGVHQFVTTHLHNDAIEGGFWIQTDNLGTQKLFWEHLQDFSIAKDGSFNPLDWKIIFPDEGGAKAVRNFQNKVKAGGTSGFSKFRLHPNEVESMDFAGNVKGKRCLLFDDMVDTGGTLVKAAEELMSQGAEEVYAACTHALLSGSAPSNLQQGPFTKVFVTDSVYIPEEKKFPKLEIVSLAPMIGTCMIKDLHGKSLRSEAW